LSFVGSVGGFERPLIQESQLSFDFHDEVQAGPLHGVHPLQIIRSLFLHGVGLVQALVLMFRRKPQAVLLTGGWVGLPVALAAWLSRIPCVIFVPDIEPALSIKVLRRFARLVLLTVAESKSYFPGNTTQVTGYPLRRQMAAATRAAASAHFRLDPNRKTLLVFGGSRGARAINEAVVKIAPEVLAAGIQVIHVTGTLDWEVLEPQFKQLTQAEQYHAFPYLHHEMGLAMAAADLVVSRAGASVLGEFPVFGLVSILIPYPHAWRYQKVNADYLASRGAAFHLAEADMTAQLLPTIMNLLGDVSRLETMRSASRELSCPDAADQAAAVILQVAEGRA
jgi:UDP-N-acetylglucosamine--N-acetylmuramyl-(pentapeptide) pyrophosphoryl-undecaprenol N-acetylglucosamine transferase